MTPSTTQAAQGDMTTPNDTLAKLAVDDSPQRIYLVLGEDIYPDDDPRTNFRDLSDVLWCEDKQFTHDIEYVRADVAALTVQALPTQEQAGWHFHRFVNGEERAEDILIEKAPDLKRAMRKAAKLCPPRPMTVLVHVTAAPIPRPPQPQEDAA